ncbi:MAG: hypothetical protein JWQ76_3153 [Ramlibacter sp.]|nr:hypothetical protein [Ramlibacter sp.]
MATGKSGLITAAVVFATFLAASARVYWGSNRPGQPPGPPAFSFQPIAGALPPFAATRAFSDLFGVQTADETIATAAEHTSLWHQQAFTLAGAPAQAVFIQTRQLDPATRKAAAGPAEAPSISAACYRLADGQWKLAGASKDFARAGGWGQAARPRGPVQVLEFPSGTVAFLFDQGGTGQGYAQVGKGVWAFASGEWRDLGFVQTGGDNGGAATAAGERYRFTGTVSMAPGSRTWPDLLVARTGTIRDERDQVVPVSDTRYVFTGKGYEEVLARR